MEGAPIAIFWVGGVLAGVGCARPSILLMPAAVAVAPAVAGVDVSRTGLSWSGVRVGMSAEDLSAVVKQRLAPELTGSELCGGYFSELRYRDHQLEVQFSGPSPGGVVESVFVAFTDPEKLLDREALSAQLHQHVPALRYQPSIHAPEVAEADNATPLYVATSNPNWAVLVKPGEGIILSLLICLD